MEQWLVNKEDLPEGIVKFQELLCGCGEPTKCWEALYDYLKSTELYHNTTNPFELFFMYIIYNLGFTEHGTSIYGSWCTQEGEEVLKWLEKNIDKVDNLVICY
jgi:hypothetical protein